MSYGKSSLLRRLIPKSYHFDGYNELNCPNTRDRPFFTEKVVQLGDYCLTTRFDKSGNLILEYSSVCPNGIISFKPYILSFEKFVELLRQALDEGSDFITFEIQVTYKYTGRGCISCYDKNMDCSSLLKLKPSSVMDAVSFEIKDIKNALSVYFGINKPSTKGGSIMNSKMKNLFGVNFEFGMCKDRNIASTLMGVAVKNPDDGNWYIFDSVSHTRTNIAGMKMGNLPIILVPATTLAVSDLIKLDGKYYYVQSIDNKELTLLGGADGVITKRLMSDSIIPGMNFYTKVVAFDAKTFTDPNSQQNLSGNILAAMCLMSWKDGKSEFSLDDVTADSFNGLGEFLPLILMSGGNFGLGNMFSDGKGGINLPMLMMLGCGDESGDNDMMQMMVLSQLLNGTNNASGVGNANPLFSPFGFTPISTAGENNEVYCPNCNKTYSADVKFCPSCGTPTEIKGKKCRKCGATLKDGAAFCHVCGQKVMADTCPKCGAKVTPEDNFCPSCGNPLKASAAPAPVPKLSESAVTTAPDATTPAKGE